MGELGAIRNFLQIDDHLATGGMPAPEDFASIAGAGFQVVFNLALPTSDHAMSNEGDLVTRSGMSYIHLPVHFESPRDSDFDRFSRMMDVLRGERVFVHCAANMRVSAFVFLHRLLGNTASRADAERDLRRIWNPDGVWRQFIDRRLAAAGRPPLS